MRFFKKLSKIVAAFALVGVICCIPAYILVFKILPEQDPDNVAPVTVNTDTIDAGTLTMHLPAKSWQVIRLSNH